MTALSTYQTGTVSVSADGTVVTGVGPIWSGLNVVAGDLISIDGEAPVLVTDVTDVTHLSIPAWAGAEKTGVTYVIYQVSALRFDDVQIALDLKKQVQAQNIEGFYIFVPSAATEPDPSLGDDGQYAFQAATGKLWVKESGVWSYLGIYKGLGAAAPWSSATAYTINDVATLNGSSYICILAHTNHTPPNATYWALLAAKGDTGAPGTNGTNGATGPAPLKPIAAWTTATAYVVGPPASFVTNAGSAYECLIAHTSGTFNTDLAAGKWGLVAAKGTDGAGTGDVVGPSGATDSALVAFDGTTGKLVKVASNHPYGSSGKFLTTGDDVDTVQANGRYMCDANVANLPTAAWYVVDHMVQGNSPPTHATQIAYQISSNVTYRRSRTTTWSAWVQIPAPTATGVSLMTSVDAAAARSAIGVRETLTADRTYYVRADGSDSNTGLADSAGGAFLTLQKAVDVVASLDCGIFNVTVQVGNGTYTQPIVLKWVFGSGIYTLQGDTTTPANVVISTTSASCFSASGHPTPWNIKGFKMQTTTSGQCIQCTGSAVINVNGNVEFGACAGYHMFVSAATMTITANYRITGGAACHINCINSGIMTFGGGLTITGVGTLAFGQFAFVNRGAGVVHFGGTFSGGTYTGTRYLVASVGYIDTNGGGANYFPGNAAGSTSGGGQYV